MRDYQRAFLEFVIATGVLRFGEFTLKSGRNSPYFFNAGLFNSGRALRRLGEFYAAAIVDWGEPFDMLFGPAYKGIPLVTAAAIALTERSGMDCPYAFNRKEAKDHGEGGAVVGAPLHGRVLIVDDVISAGISVGESVDLIRTNGAQPVAVFIALDRQERARDSARSAADEVRARFGIEVRAIADLDTLVEFLGERPDHAPQLAAIDEYRKRYGAGATDRVI